MKFKKITAILGLTSVVFHSNLFGTKKPYAKFSEEDLEALENALENKTEGNEDELQEQINQLSQENNTLQEQASATEKAVAEALALAGLTAKETLVENVALLGEKCKEYGERKNRHSMPENNGTEEPTNGLINGYLDPNDEHNKFLNSL